MQVLTDVSVSENLVSCSGWKMLEWNATLQTAKYPSRVNNSIELASWSEAVYILRLKREPDFYIKMLLVPVLALSFLIPAIFWIPPERPDRIAFGENGLHYVCHFPPLSKACIITNENRYYCLLLLSRDESVWRLCNVAAGCDGCLST